MATYRKIIYDFYMNVTRLKFRLKTTKCLLLQIDHKVMVSSMGYCMGTTYINTCTYYDASNDLVMYGVGQYRRT